MITVDRVRLLCVDASAAKRFTTWLSSEGIENTVDGPVLSVPAAAATLAVMITESAVQAGAATTAEAQRFYDEITGGGAA